MIVNTNKFSSCLYVNCRLQTITVKWYLSPCSHADLGLLQFGTSLQPRGSSATSHISSVSVCKPQLTNLYIYMSLGQDLSRSLRLSGQQIGGRYHGWHIWRNGCLSEFRNHCISCLISVLNTQHIDNLTVNPSLSCQWQRTQRNNGYTSSQCKVVFRKEANTITPSAQIKYLKCIIMKVTKFI